MNKIISTLAIVVMSASVLITFHGNSFAATQNNFLNPSVPSVPSINDTLDFLKTNDLFKNAAQSKGIDTSIPKLPNLKSFLDTKDLSFNDVSSSLRSIGILAINLFLIVIQTVAGILKGLLPFLR